MKEENLNEEVEKLLNKIDDNLITYLKKNGISYRAAAQQSKTQYAELSRIGTREDRHVGLVLLLKCIYVFKIDLQILFPGDLFPYNKSGHQVQLANIASMVDSPGRDFLKNFCDAYVKNIKFNAKMDVYVPTLLTIDEVVEGFLCEIEDNILLLIGKLGLSRRKFCEIAHLEASTACRVLNRKKYHNHFGIRTILKIAYAFNFNPIILMPDCFKKNNLDIYFEDLLIGLDQEKCEFLIEFCESYVKEYNRLLEKFS